MIPWVLLDTAKVPGGSGDLRLMQRGTEFAIMAGATILMNSRMSSSEIALADLASERLRGRAKARVLIGGYGMGFTLRAALSGLGADTKIVVAELVPQVIAWARGPMADLSAGCLDDPRVTVHDGDVGEAMVKAPGGFDAILLDVDNGPDGLSRAANDSLYSARGLETARQALRPGGLLAIWSAAQNKPFSDRLARAGFAVEEVRSRANKGRGVRHFIWAATKPAAPKNR